jgi:hypothetical protein
MSSTPDDIATESRAACYRYCDSGSCAKVHERASEEIKRLDLHVLDLHETNKTLAEEIAEWRKWWGKGLETTHPEGPTRPIQLARRVTDLDPTAIAAVRAALGDKPMSSTPDIDIGNDWLPPGLPVWDTRYSTSPYDIITRDKHWREQVQIRAAEIRTIREQRDSWKESANEYSACLQPLVMDVLYKHCEPVSHGWPGKKHVEGIREGVDFLLDTITTLRSQVARERAEDSRTIQALIKERDKAIFQHNQTHAAATVVSEGTFTYDFGDRMVNVVEREDMIALRVALGVYRPTATTPTPTTDPEIEQLRSQVAALTAQRDAIVEACDGAVGSMERCGLVVQADILRSALALIKQP